MSRDRDYKISVCRYFDGEDRNPFEGKDQNRAMLWFYERCWVESAQDDSVYLEEYISVDLANFESRDSVPTSLKALLFNRYAKGCQSMMLAVEPFKEFYHQYYPNKGYRYYQGESRCPAEDLASDLKCAFWEAEAHYYHNESDLSAEYPTLCDYVRHYCNAISDKWCCSGYSAEDIFNDYLAVDKDTLQ
ncbi:MAG: hypothetical protein SNI20_05935 [Rikenellaceae bacterium]